MQIGHYVEVLEIVPDETPGLDPDGDAHCRHADADAAVGSPRLGSVDEALGRSAVYAS